MFEQRLPAPRGVGAIKKLQFMIRCTPEEHDAITKAANKLHLTKSDFVRQAISEKIKKEQEDGNS